VAQVHRCTESGDAPGWQGATTENTGEYLRKEQRSQAGCSAARMQMELRHGLFKPETRFSALRKRVFDANWPEATDKWWLVCD